MSPEGTNSARIRPPSSWRTPDTHFLTVLEDPWYRHVFELTDLFHTATVDFWRSRDGRAAYLPLTTGSVSSPMGRGSDSIPVAIQVSGVDTYLADSMQFLLELTCRLTPGPSYYVMPSFRGEQADQTHLCQFFHSEAEFTGGLDDCVDTVNDYVRHLAETFLDQAGDLVARLAGGNDHLKVPLDGDAFRRLTFDEAARLLDDREEFVGGVGTATRSLTRAGERRLMELVGQFVWVTHMDHLSVPFYQAFEPGDRDRARNGDLLFGIGETVGCGERHETAAEVREALDLHEVTESAYAWYVRMRELTPLRTSGFGMGVERFVLWLTGHDDIRDLPLLLRFNGQRIDP
ncbi:amino acid--tRNA ligase-related protein [Actinophytocola oryzae]|uniref:Asparaginyl-tRNA synthetase n=1 Tax=Actinophytocola oryzae TaxID=502181 RepID=A0A4R7VH81_9PSEU|nr:amino acid--tRNA ligase-related protein [Actinophytocola oryzae]TDV48693.1 asparaginyl-tRNA synthetase [Actinophytocola oryzae]